MNVERSAEVVRFFIDFRSPLHFPINASHINVIENYIGIFLKFGPKDLNYFAMGDPKYSHSYSRACTFSKFNLEVTIQSECSAIDYLSDAFHVT